MQDLSEFWSGEDYDAQYAHVYDNDIQFLSRLIEQKKARSLLDICCGTGIVTVPLSEKVEHTTGVDIAPSMLEQARRRATGRSHVDFLLADATTFTLDRTFDLAIMTGNAFQAFLHDDVMLALLNNVYRHLSPDGHLIFDTRLMTAENITETTDYALFNIYDNAHGERVSLYGKYDRFDKSDSIMYITQKRVYPDGVVVHSSINLKYRSQDNIQQLCELAGFELIHQYGNWKGDAWINDDNNMICILKKR